MSNILKLAGIVVVLAVSQPVIAADESACLACHAKELFKDMSDDDIVSAVTESDIPMHKSFTDLDDEELRKIAEALTGC